MSLVHPRGVYALWLRDVKRFLRSRALVLGTTVMTLLTIVFLGFGFSGAEIPGLPAGVDYHQFLVATLIGLMAMLGGSLTGVAMLVDQQLDFLKVIFVSPISRTSIVLGRIAGTSTNVVVQAVVIVVALLPMGLEPPSVLSVPLAVAFVVPVVSTFAGLGIALASRFRDTQGFAIILQFVFLPLFFLSGAIYPVESLPTPLRLFAYLNPLTYGIDGLRGALIGASAYPLVLDFGVVVVSSVAMVGIGAFLFERAEVV